MGQQLSGGINEMPGVRGVGRAGDGAGGAPAASPAPDRHPVAGAGVQAGRQAPPRPPEPTALAVAPDNDREIGGDRVAASAAPPRTAGGACHLAAGGTTARTAPHPPARPRVSPQGPASLRRASLRAAPPRCRGAGPTAAAGSEGCPLQRAGSRREVRKYRRNRSVIVCHELFIASGLTNFCIMASLIPDQLMENEI